MTASSDQENNLTIQQRKCKVVNRLRVRTRRTLPPGQNGQKVEPSVEKEFKKLTMSAVEDTNVEIDVSSLKKWPLEKVNDLFNIAVEHGNQRLVAALIEFMSKNQIGDALIKSSRCGHVNIAATLLEKNAYLDYKKDDQTPLIAAVKNEQQNMVKYLLNKKADIFSVDGHHNTILHIAAKMGDRGICKLALLNGTQPHLLNEDEKTPIELSKSEDVARTILTSYLAKVKNNDEFINPYDCIDNQDVPIPEFDPNNAEECQNPFDFPLDDGSRLAELFWSGIYHMGQVKCLNVDYNLYPFDRLEFREKTVLLYSVAECFCTNREVQRNFLNECTLYAIFEIIFDFVKVEITNDVDSTSFKWRTKVIYAFEEVYNLDSADFGLSEKCRTVEVWRPLIEQICHVFFGGAFWDKKRLFTCKNVLERREFVGKFKLPKEYFKYP